MRLMPIIHAVISICLCTAIPLQAETASTATSSLITPDHVEAIYKNLVQTHWVPQTGLFLSFPDSSDLKAFPTGFSCMNKPPWVCWPFVSEISTGPMGFITS